MSLAPFEATSATWLSGSSTRSKIGSSILQHGELYMRLGAYLKKEPMQFRIQPSAAQ